MIKADNKVVYEDLGKDEQPKFTNFELLQKEVEVLKEHIDEIIEILKYNDLERQETIKPVYFDDNEVYKRLEDRE